MPALARNAPSLLRQVRNKPHATHEDHEEDQLPTPPDSNTMRRKGAATTGARSSTNKKEDDIYVDPASSSDEDAAALPTANKSASFKPSKPFEPANNLAASKSTFKNPPGISPESTHSSKRSSSDEADDADPGASSGSDDKMVFSSQPSQSFKRKRSLGTGKPRQSVNIHAPTAKYGRKPTVFTAKNRKNAVQPQKATGFKAAKGSELMPPKPQAPAFKAAKGADMFTFGHQEEVGAVDGDAPGSPELSELSSLDSDVEEVDPQTLGLPTPKHYVASTNCPICRTSVPILLKQEFEDTFTKGKAMDYKWQQRFCYHHKKDSAKRTYEERGYPDIKWESLERRVRHQHDRILAVLEGRGSSVYRKRLQKQIDSGSVKSARSALLKKLVKGDLEIRPGYYGPKGEKLMMEHILHHLSDELRERSANDPLIAAFGLAGGVSGFVQAVLVPEVAVALVKADLMVDEQRARDVLAESWELGELVNDEADEKVESDD